jgi:hypothetical protein
MDDGIAAGKCRDRLRPQQAMSIGNRANGSHHARSAYKMSRVQPGAPVYSPMSGNSKRGTTETLAHLFRHSDSYLYSGAALS